MLGWRSILISLAVIVGFATVGAIIGGVAIPESQGGPYCILGGSCLNMSHGDWALVGVVFGALGGLVLAILLHVIPSVRSE